MFAENKVSNSVRLLLAAASIVILLLSLKSVQLRKSWRKSMTAKEEKVLHLPRKKSYNGSVGGILYE
jgi:hypothetical protein